MKASALLNNRHVRKLSRWFPQVWRDAAFRRLVRVPAASEDDLQIKIAETTDEFVQALELLHQTYRERGYDEPNAAGIRLTPYHLLPTTTVVIAKRGEEVLGTVSMIKDSPLGLPTDDLMDLGQLRRYGERIAEGSSIAVAPQCRDRRLMFLLMKYLWEYLAQHCGVRHLVVTVHPRHEDMYRAALLFRRFRGRARETYDFVKADGVVPLMLDLKSAPRRFEQVYGQCAPRSNLYRFFVLDRRAELKFPDRSLLQANHSGVSSDVLRAVIARGLMPTGSLKTDALTAALEDAHGLNLGPPADHAMRLRRAEAHQQLRDDARWGEWWAVHVRGVLHGDELPLAGLPCRVLSVRPDVVELGFRRQQHVPTWARLTLSVSAQRTLAVDVRLKRSVTGQRVRYEVDTTDPIWYELAGSLIRRNQRGDTGLRDGPRHHRAEFPDTAWRMPDSLLSAFAAD